MATDYHVSYGMQGSAFIITELNSDGTSKIGTTPMVFTQFDEFGYELDADEGETKVLEDTQGINLSSHNEEGSRRGLGITWKLQTINPKVMTALNDGEAEYVTPGDDTSGIKKYGPRWAALAANKGRVMLEWYMPNTVDGTFTVLRYFYVQGDNEVIVITADDFLKVDYTGKSLVSPNLAYPRRPYELEFGVAEIPTPIEIAA